MIPRKRYRFKFLADNKTSLLPKIKMKGIEIVKGQQPLQWHKDWSLFLSWEGVWFWSRSISLLKVSVIGSLCKIFDLQQVLSQRNLGMNKILASTWSQRSEMLQVNISSSKPVSNNLVHFYLTKEPLSNFQWYSKKKNIQGSRNLNVLI